MESVESVVAVGVDSLVDTDSVTVTNAEVVDVNVISIVVSGSSVETAADEDPERGSTDDVSLKGGRVVWAKADEESGVEGGAAVLTVQPDGIVTVVLGEERV